MIKQLAYTLTGEDVQKCIPFECPIYHYSDLKDLDSLQEMLHPNDCCVLFFETGRREDKSQAELNTTLFGHWVCLTLSPKSSSIRSKNDLPFSVNYVNSYGVKPDDEKSYTNKEYQELIGQLKNVLSKLLYQASEGLDIEYNEEDLQEESTPKREINTCGRHCVVRILLKDIPLDTYQKFLKLKGSTPDEKVCIITEPILKGEITAEQAMNKLNDLINDLILI